MKHLNDFLMESKSSYNSKKIEKALENCAWGVLDYFNQEGISGWDERDIKKYVNGDKEPDFKTIVDAMIGELEEYGDKDKILPILKKYDTDEWHESIDVAILCAMKDYVKDI